MIVYIAGKMTGLPDKGRAAFAQAERKLTDMGHTVLNPAWLGDGLPQKMYMPICLTMLNQAEALALLDGWETSMGATLEKMFAKYQKIPVFELNQLLERTEEARTRVMERLAKDLRMGLSEVLPGMQSEKNYDEIRSQIAALTNEGFLARLEPLVEPYAQEHFPYDTAYVLNQAFHMVKSGWNPDRVLEHFGGQSHGQ
ncbi:MAG: DUF4406 domain-containing protein [Clostridia bacterium]|nr:DUF4406 domain-containing protein [Clostridia bacterium]